MIIFVPVSNAQAETVDTSINHVTDGRFYPLHFDQLAFDFNLIGSNILTALTIDNVGFYENQGIEKLCLYLDAGSEGFQGMGVDSDLGCATWSESFNYWYWDDLFEAIAGTTRFFVTIETNNFSRDLTVQLKVPAFNDKNANGFFDEGDNGVFFFDDLLGVPAEDLMDSSVFILDYRDGGGDIFLPKVVATNIFDGDYIHAGIYYSIEGLAKDQGGLSVIDVEVCIDDKCEKATGYDSEFASWYYDWDLTDQGYHLIYFTAKDTNSNVVKTDTINVFVDMTPEVHFDFTYIDFNTFYPVVGGDPLIIDVYVHDQYDKPIADQLVEISPDESFVQVDKYFDYSGSDGHVQFKSWSDEPGFVDYYFYIEDIEYDYIYGVSFEAVEQVPVDMYSQVNTTYLNGRWVKLADNSAVYFLDNNSVRHAYPTQKVWESYFGLDFSFVEIINTTEMANYKLGSNVPFNGGTLIKIPSVPKVYIVDGSGLMHWIQDEMSAQLNFGADWASKVRDLPESFFTDYSEGEYYPVG